MAQPPKRPVSGKAPPRPAKPPRLKWDAKPKRKPNPDAPVSKGALERADGEERIAKLLARAGVASRREIERMIADKPPGDGWCRRGWFAGRQRCSWGRVAFLLVGASRNPALPFLKWTPQERRPPGFDAPAARGFRWRAHSRGPQGTWSIG